jgi:hypothetical protein
MLKRWLLATLAVAVGLIAYNGHAGLGAPAYQHNQTDPEFLAAASVSDGTSNTVMSGERAAREAKGFTIDIGTSEKIAPTVSS